MVSRHATAAGGNSALLLSGSWDTGLVPMLLNDMPPEWAGRVFLHPIHQDAFRDSVQLIADLRQCRNYRDYYQFQQRLLGKVLEIQ
jgi:hypothetical protein